LLSFFQSLILYLFLSFFLPFFFSCSFFILFVHSFPSYQFLSISFLISCFFPFIFLLSTLIPWARRTQNKRLYYGHRTGGGGSFLTGRRYFSLVHIFHQAPVQLFSQCLSGEPSPRVKKLQPETGHQILIWCKI
jgi:hypothetical protein